MIPTYCTEITTVLLTQYVQTNLVAVLINDPSLGYTDNPTSLQLANRKALDMNYVVTKEITLSGGYSRAICSVDQLSTEPENNRSRLFVRAVFEPTGVLDEATHLVFVTHANLVGANPVSNGNNRADNTGTVVKVVPLQFAPIRLATPVPYTYLADITVSF